MRIYFVSTALNEEAWRSGKTELSFARAGIPSGSLPEQFLRGDTFQTDEADPARLLVFLRERLAPQRLSCVLYIPGGEPSPLRRVYNLDREGVFTMRPGEVLFLGWFGGETQYFGARVEINGIPLYLLSMGKDKDRFCLHFLCPYIPPVLPEGWTDGRLTPRQYAKAEQLREERLPFDSMPAWILADGARYGLSSRTTSFVGAPSGIGDLDGQLLRDYLTQEGVLPAELAEGCAAFITCSMEQDAPPPALPVQALTLGFEEQRRTHLLELPFTVRMGEQDELLCWTAPDGSGQKLYVEGYELSDPYAEENIPAGPAAEHYLEMLEGYLSRDRRMFILRYESSWTEGLQLRGRKELDEVEVPTSAGAIGWIFGTSAESGPHGLPLRAHVLGTVPMDFIGSMEAELFSIQTTSPAPAAIRVR